MSLLNEEKTDINERAVFIFSEIFNEYAIQDPDQLDRKIMFNEQLNNFLSVLTGGNATILDHKNIESFFVYDHDQDGKLECDEFTQFYRDACI